MSESPTAPGRNAVFLSYASQDAEAAKRICEALRAAGVEVWFDQNELGGGDAWDQKIKKQIRECALFVPLISANTNARLEGYFRREWKLAVERTHDMADEKAFLLPVVVDATSDAAASVPEKFREVQWTRLPGGEVSPAFCDRVRTLLGGRAEQPAPTARLPVPPRRQPSRRLSWSLVALVVVAAVGGTIVWRIRPAPAESALQKVAATGPTDRSIAVLPFANLSDEKENAYFADGVHEDLLTNLAGLRALKVVSRTSVMQYRGTTKNVREIARELGVAYVLEGSVRRAGRSIRVTGQLIEAATDQHLWAKNYTRDLEDVFAVQSELAREIATALHAALSPAEISGLEERPTKNLEAYDCLQQARALDRASARSDRATREQLIPLVERAVALDPNYAEAWAKLSEFHLNYYFQADRTEAQLAKAKAALTQAERLAPNLYPVLMAGSNFGAVTGDRELVNERRRRIIELFPNRPEAFLAKALTANYEKRWVEAVAHTRAGLQLDPRNPELLGNYFSLLDSFRRWDEAAAVARTLAEVEPDNLDARLTGASMIYRQSGSTAQLTRLLADLPRSGATASSLPTIRLRIAFLTGDWAGIVDLWREHGPQLRTGGVRMYQTRFVVAGALLRLGDPASARPLLEQIVGELRLKLEASTDDPVGWTDLGLALGMLGDAAAARTALDRSARLVATQRPDPARNFSFRWDEALARSWIGEKRAAIAALDAMLREPVPHPPTSCVRVLRVHWASFPLLGDPEFEAMLNDPRNNAPLL